MTEFPVLSYASAVLLPTLSAAIWNSAPTRRQTRANTFFGARVVPEFRDSNAGAAILRQFRWRLWTWSLMGAAVCVLGITPLPQDQRPMHSRGLVTGVAV